MTHDTCKKWCFVKVYGKRERDSYIKDIFQGRGGRLLDTLLVHVGRITRSRAFRTVANANVARSNEATRSSTPAALARGSMIAITDVTGRLIGRDPSNRSIPPVITSNSGRCTRRRPTNNTPDGRLANEVSERRTWPDLCQFSFPRDEYRLTLLQFPYASEHHTRHRISCRR